MLARPDWTSFAWQAKKSGIGSIEVEKHEAVVSGIMSSIGFDTLELSAQTIKAGAIAFISALQRIHDASTY